MTSKIDLDQDSKPEPYQENIDEIVNDPDIKRIYANGFTIFVGNSDFGVILKTNNKTTHVLNISYTLAKTLHVKLHQMISRLEESTNHEIMITDIINDKFLGKSKKG